MFGNEQIWPFAGRIMLVIIGVGSGFDRAPASEIEQGTRHEYQA
jgi:hypothetical protein